MSWSGRWAPATWGVASPRAWCSRPTDVCSPWSSSSGSRTRARGARSSPSSTSTAAATGRCGRWPGPPEAATSISSPRFAEDASGVVVWSAGRARRDLRRRRHRPAYPAGARPPRRDQPVVRGDLGRGAPDLVRRRGHPVRHERSPRPGARGARRAGPGRARGAGRKPGRDRRRWRCGRAVGHQREDRGMVASGVAAGAFGERGPGRGVGRRRRHCSPCPRTGCSSPGTSPAPRASAGPTAARVTGGSRTGSRWSTPGGSWWRRRGRLSARVRMPETSPRCSSTRGPVARSTASRSAPEWCSSNSGSSVAVSPDRRLVAVTHGFGTAIVDTRTREIVHRVVLPIDEPVAGPAGHGGVVQCLDARRLAPAAVRRWGGDDPQEHLVVRRHRDLATGRRGRPPRGGPGPGVVPGPLGARRRTAVPTAE